MTIEATITIRVRKHESGHWSAVEPESDAPAGRGPTRHDAVAAYVSHARRTAQAKRADGGERTNHRNPEQSGKICRAIGRIAGRCDAETAHSRNDSTEDN